MYDGAKTRVRTVGGDSEHFPVVMGLHQGSVLSPFLFALVLDALTHYIQGEMPWCMLFVDDIVLIDKTRVGVNERLEVSQIELEMDGIAFAKPASQLRCGAEHRTLVVFVTFTGLGRLRICDTCVIFANFKSQK
uniref:Reverse transcriptase domain-containing protein n=1 Tax=Nicotiana tabacum TaxID=4097 RepID=A0A1S4DBM9_TOBAC|nr:PREDICTED: uncharacterized protein LOC107828072 [Nicotiana tabacum]